jgi:hypothetical protein
MEIPTFREETCKKRVAHFRSQILRRSLLTTAERADLLKEMQSFADSLSLGTGALGGAGIGLGASVLPVIGFLTGPLIGGLYGAYRSQKLARYRREVQEMIRLLVA